MARRVCRMCGAPAEVQRRGVNHITRCTKCDWKTVKTFVSKGKGG